MNSIFPLFQNKKILILLGSLELGGAERQALLYAKYLKQNFNANIEICGFSNPGKVTEFCNKNDIPWRIFKNPLSTNPIKRYFLLNQLIVELRKNQPDIILSYTLIPNIIAGLCWKQAGAKLCVWNQRDGGIESFSWRLERKALNACSAILSNSVVGADYLCRTFKIDAKKVHVIPNAISMEPPREDRTNWRKKMGIHEDAFIAGMIANLSKWKDHKTLIESWKIIIDNASRDNIEKPYLVLAGRFDANYPLLVDLVSENNLQDNVLFLGKVDDISGLLLSIDLGIMSSRNEGCPNGILECMALGLPVIGTDIPGIREAVGAGNERFLVPAGNAFELAKTIQKLIRDKDLRKEAGLLNRKRIHEKFESNVIWKKQTSLICKGYSDE